MTLLQDPDQVQADPSPLNVHVEDLDLHPLPRTQSQAAAPLVDGQFVWSDSALVDEACVSHAYVYKGPEQRRVVHAARQHRAHLQVAHGHDAPLKVRLPKIWGLQKIYIHIYQRSDIVCVDCTSVWEERQEVGMQGSEGRGGSDKHGLHYGR